MALGGASSLLDPLLQGLHIGQDQLGLDNVDIALRIDSAFDVDNIFVVEASNHVKDRIDFADIGQEFVSQPFAFRCTLDEARDVYNFADRGNHRIGVDELMDDLQARVWNRNDTNIWIDGAERIVGRLGTCFG